MVSIYKQMRVKKDGTLLIKGLPELAGHKVDVIVRDKDKARTRPTNFPLRGIPIELIDPFGSVAEKDWNIQE